MQATDRRLFLLGLRPTGDLADLTCYTSKRGRIVWFPKSPPQKPPSMAQIHQRNKFRAAAQAWRTLEPQIRANWLAAAKKASLFATGYDLWIFWQLKRDTAAIRTIERQTHLQLLPL